MRGESYRITTPTLGIIVVDGSNVPATIPLGAIVTVQDVDINGNRLVEVIWEDRITLMFTQDLRQRGELVKRARVKQ